MSNTLKCIFWLPPKFEVLCMVLKVCKVYLSCYSLCLRNKYTDKITYIYPSNLRWDIINLQMDAMDMTWILMAPSSKWGCENIHHRQSIGTYFLTLAHMEVFSELSAGWISKRPSAKTSQMTVNMHNHEWLATNKITKWFGGWGSGRGEVSRPTWVWGRCVSQHALRQTPPRRRPATAAGGTHPTGMHSCLE